MVTTTRVLIPLHASAKPLLSDDVHVLHVQQSLWSALFPLVYDSNKKLAKRVAQVLLQNSIRYEFPPDKNGIMEEEPIEDDTIGNNFMRRTFSLRQPDQQTSLLSKGGRTSQQQTGSTTTLLILPLHNSTRLQYAFSCRLNTYEHKILQAYSISSYMATLGGGFFFCRHYQTAAQLAIRQQALAQHVLQDTTLAATCWIHVAYNCAYRGEFRVAERILRQVSEHIIAEAPENETVNKMCASAWLLCHRMRRMHKVMASCGEDSLTVDDYQRIRVLQDQSTKRGNTELVVAVMDTTSKQLKLQNQ